MHNTWQDWQDTLTNCSLLPLCCCHVGTLQCPHFLQVQSPSPQL